MKDTLADTPVDARIVATSNCNTDLTDITAQTKLFQKILAAQEKLESLEKSGKNEYHKYTYSTSGDVLLPAQQACNSVGLLLTSDCIAWEILPGRATVTIEVKVIDSETGVSYSVKSPGYAEDSKGDKAVFKAITGGEKYGVRLMFCLASDDDPESSPKNSNGKTNSTNKLSASRPAANNSSPAPTSPQSPKSPADEKKASFITQTSTELQRLGWSTDRAKKHVSETYGKEKRQDLTEAQLQEFLQYLKSQPSATVETAAG